MSPVDVYGHLAPDGFPRVSGDEPTSSSAALPASAFSPRERG